MFLINLINTLFIGFIKLETKQWLFYLEIISKSQNFKFCVWFSSARLLTEITQVFFWVISFLLPASTRLFYLHNFRPVTCTETVGKSLLYLRHLPLCSLIDHRWKTIKIPQYFVVSCCEYLVLQLNKFHFWIAIDTLSDLIGLRNGFPLFCKSNREVIIFGFMIGYGYRFRVHSQNITDIASSLIFFF